MDTQLLANECIPLEEISIKEIDGVTFFLIPKSSCCLCLDRSCEAMGKKYQVEYHRCLEEQYKLTQEYQDLLCERDSLVKAISEREQVSSVSGEKLLKKKRKLAHQVDRDFVCSLCGKAYGSKTALRYHEKSKHGSPNN